MAWGPWTWQKVSGVRAVLWRTVSLTCEVWANSGELVSEVTVHTDMYLKLFKQEKIVLKMFWELRRGLDFAPKIREEEGRWEERVEVQRRGKQLARWEGCVLWGVIPAVWPPAPQILTQVYQTEGVCSVSGLDWKSIKEGNIFEARMLVTSQAASQSHHLLQRNTKKHSLASLHGYFVTWEPTWSFKGRRLTQLHSLKPVAPNITHN